MPPSTRIRLSFVLSAAALLGAATASCGARSDLAGVLDPGPLPPGSNPSDAAAAEPMDGGSPPLPAHDASVGPGSRDASDGSTPDAGPIEATSPDATPGPCAYTAADASVPDAGPVGPWANTIGAQVSAVAHDQAGNLFAVGFIGQLAMFLAKFDPTGNVLWSKSFGDEYVFASDVTVDGAGDVLVAGSANWDGYDFGAGANPAGGFVVKFDRDGGLVWQRIWAFGEAATNVKAYDVRALSSGALVVVGTIDGTVDLGTGPLTGTDNLFVARLDPCGNVLASRVYGGAGGEFTTGIVVDPNDDWYLAGAFNGSLDFGQGAFSAPDWTAFVAKFDSSSTPIASRQLPGSGPNTKPGSLALDPDGNLLLAGTFDFSIDLGAGPIASAGDSDMYIAKLAPALDTIWALTLGDPNEQRAFAVAADTNGDVVFTGMLAGDVPFGGTSLVAPTDAGPGVAQLFVARVTSSGAPVNGAVALGGGDSQSLGATLLSAGTGAVIVGGGFWQGLELGPASFEGSAGVLLRFAP